MRARPLALALVALLLPAVARPQADPERLRTAKALFFDGEYAQARQAMEQALRDFRSRFGREYELLLAGARLKTEEKFQSRNPSRPAISGICRRAPAFPGNSSARNVPARAYTTIPRSPDSFQGPSSAPLLLSETHRFSCTTLRSSTPQSRTEIP